MSGRATEPMGLGSTAKKLQRVTDTAEELYGRINDLRDQVVEMRKTVVETNDRIEALEAESAEQRALLEALAEREGIDVEAVTADAHIGEAEGTAEAAESDAGTAGDSDGAADGTATDGTVAEDA